MQTPSKNKALDGAPQEYFFPGGLQYRPQTIIAGSREEAEELYEKSKQKVESLPVSNETTS